MDRMGTTEEEMRPGWPMDKESKETWVGGSMGGDGGDRDRHGGRSKDRRASGRKQSRPAKSGEKC